MVVVQDAPYAICNCMVCLSKSYVDRKEGVDEDEEEGVELVF